ncbi:phosphatase PAP2 family protein [Spirosoma aerolatum]|uniref:phosphatase PAP2 family protein n=1 Tax=Spirosoma aerolatum TaxID=1211326 RepID=UPI0012D2FF24|nr:phosphatase PAP2 family protein [Spirosoma aerolatum]
MIETIQRVWKGIHRKILVVPTVYIIHYSVSIGICLAQSPYQLRTGREIGLLGAGAVTLGASVALTNAIDPLTTAEIASLNRGDISSFDRNATFHWSTSADKWSDVALVGTIGAAGVVSLGLQPIRQDFKTVAVMYVETLLLANGIERTVKSVTQRTRPYVYNPLVPLDEKLDRTSRQSFFSGHATNAFATAVFTSEVFRHYFPHSKLKPVVWVGTLGLASATALFRYEAGLHYPTDLLAGAAFGSLVGWGIPKLHQIKKGSDLGKRLDVQPWSNGMANGIYMRLAVFSR